MNTTSNLKTIVSAEQIRETEPQNRDIKVYPWMAAYMSRLWQDMKKSIVLELEHRANSGFATVSGFAIASGTAEQHRSDQ